MRTAEKILSLEDLVESVNNLRQAEYKIVQCHGVFDLMHPGHIFHLESASEFGDILIVTITPDRFVNKGLGRPVFNETIRCRSIAALESVAYVSLNRWPTAIETLKMLRPDIYVKGTDYKDPKDDPTGMIVKEMDILKEYGGEIRYTDEITFSSTKILRGDMWQ